MNRITMLLMIVLFAPINIHAQESSIRMELEDIAGEYATCAAYYRHSYLALMASNRQDRAVNFRSLFEDAMFYSLLLANEGRESDMAVQVTNARIESKMKLMSKDIDNRYENFAILINKYAEKCTVMSQTPPPAAQKVILKLIEEVSADKKQ